MFDYPGHCACIAAATGLASSFCFFTASSEYRINAHGKDERTATRWTRTAFGWAMISFVGFGVLQVLKKD
jgi:hypothetical protein